MLQRSTPKQKLDYEAVGSVYNVMHVNIMIAGSESWYIVASNPLLPEIICVWQRCDVDVAKHDKIAVEKWKSKKEKWKTKNNPRSDFEYTLKLRQKRNWRTLTSILCDVKVEKRKILRSVWHAQSINFDVFLRCINLSFYDGKASHYAM